MWLWSFRAGARPCRSACFFSSILHLRPQMRFVQGMPCRNHRWLLPVLTCALAGRISGLVWFSQSLLEAFGIFPTREPVIPGKLLHGRWEGALPHSPGPSWQLGWGGARCGPWERGPQRGVGREAPLLPLMEFLFPRWGEGMKGGVDSPGWKDACLPASGLACLSARTPGPTLLTALALTDPFCPAFSAASSRKTALLPLDLR